MLINGMHQARIRLPKKFSKDFPRLMIVQARFISNLRVIQKEWLFLTIFYSKMQAVSSAGNDRIFRISSIIPIIWPTIYFLGQLFGIIEQNYFTSSGSREALICRALRLASWRKATHQTVVLSSWTLSNFCFSSVWRKVVISSVFSAPLSS